ESSRGINKADHRPVELLCLFHKTESLSVAFRRRHTEIPGNIILCISSLLNPDDCHRLSVQDSKTSYNSSVIPESPVSVKFHKTVKNSLYIIQTGKTFRIPCRFYFFPGCHLFFFMFSSGLFLFFAFLRKINP